MADSRLKILLNAKDRASSVISGVGANVKSFAMNAAMSYGVFTAATITANLATQALSASVSYLKDQLADGITAAIDFEQTQMQFETIMQSGEKAKALLNDLTSFAASTPFQFEELKEGVTQLVVARTSFDELIPKMRMLGDVAAGVNAPIKDIANIYGRVKTNAVASMAEINRLSDRGVPIIQTLAKQYGVAEGEIKKMVSTGKVGFKDIDQAFQTMTSNGGMFAGMMEKQSGTLGGLISTLKDNVALSMRGLAEGVIKALNVKKMTSGLIQMTGFIRENVMPIIIGTVTKIAHFLKSTWPKIKAGIMQVKDWAVALFDFLAPLVMQHINVMTSLFDQIWNAVKWTFGKIKDFVMPFFEAIGIRAGSFFDDLKALILEGQIIAELAFKHIEPLWENVVIRAALMISQIQDKIEQGKNFAIGMGRVLWDIGKAVFDDLGNIASEWIKGQLNAWKNFIPRLIEAAKGGDIKTLIRDMVADMTRGLDQAVGTAGEAAMESVVKNAHYFADVESDVTKDIVKQLQESNAKIVEALDEHRNKRLEESGKVSISSMSDSLNGFLKGLAQPKEQAAAVDAGTKIGESLAKGMEGQLAGLMPNKIGESLKASLQGQLGGVLGNVKKAKIKVDYGGSEALEVTNRFTGLAEKFKVEGERHDHERKTEQNTAKMVGLLSQVVQKMDNGQSINGISLGAF